jgi:hypothetical protein
MLQPKLDEIKKQYADEISFDDKEVQRFLSDLRKSAANPEKIEPLLAAFSSIVFADVIDHFKMEKGEAGAWKAWSKAYERHMRRAGFGGNKKLQFSGRMRQNFKPENRRISPQSISWFNNAKTKSGFPYAFAHNTGGPKLPQRDFMWLSKQAFFKFFPYRVPDKVSNDIHGDRFQLIFHVAQRENDKSFVYVYV